MSTDASTITTEAQLRELYRTPSPLVQAKKLDHLDATTMGFLAGSPFCLLATASADGSCDVSPRGGPPGFVRPVDDRTVVLPDLSGNNLVDSLLNIVANGHAGLLVVIPGREETLRLDGRADLTVDPTVLALWDDELRTPKLAVRIALDHVFIHCAKSFRRGQVWQPEAWPGLAAGVPDGCDVIISNLALEVEPDVVRADLEAGYRVDLESERRQSGTTSILD